MTPSNKFTFAQFSVGTGYCAETDLFPQMKTSRKVHVCLH